MSVQVYRKKSTEVEALRFLAYTEALGPAKWNSWEGGKLYQWLAQHRIPFRVTQVDPGPAYVIINAPSGSINVNVGDWVIRDADGNFSKCSTEEFERTYDRVENEQ